MKKDGRKKVPLVGCDSWVRTAQQSYERSDKADERWESEAQCLIQLLLPTLIVFHDEPTWQCSHLSPNAPSCLSSLPWQLTQLAARVILLLTGILWQSAQRMSLCFPSSLNFVLSWSKSQFFQSRVLWQYSQPVPSVRLCVSCFS